MKLLAITPSFWPNENPEAIVNTKLLAALRARGVQVDFVSRRAPTVEPTELRSDYAREQANRRLVSRAALPLRNWRDLARRTIGWRAMQSARYAREYAWARRATRAVIQHAKITGSRYDLILSFGGFCHIAGLRCSSQLRVPLVANWNDPFPPIIAPPPYGLGEQATVPFCYRWLLNRVGNQACWHTFASERLRLYLLRYLPDCVNQKSSVVPHMASPAPRPARRSGNDRFTITHAGGLLPYRKVDTFFEGLWIFLQSGVAQSDISVKFIGPFNDRLSQVASRYGLQSLLELIEEMPYAACQRRMAESDILLIVEARMREGIFLPSKLADYAQTGRPILAVTPRAGTLSDYLNGHGGGLAVDCERPADVAEGLTRLYRAWLSGKLDEEYSSDRLVPLFSEQRIVQIYQEILNRVLDGACAARVGNNSARSQLGAARGNVPA